MSKNPTILLSFLSVGLTIYVNINRGYYVATWVYKISLHVLKHNIIFDESMK